MNDSCKECNKSPAPWIYSTFRLCVSCNEERREKLGFYCGYDNCKKLFKKEDGYKDSGYQFCSSNCFDLHLKRYCEDNNISLNRFITRALKCSIFGNKEKLKDGTKIIIVK